MNKTQTRASIKRGDFAPSLPPLLFGIPIPPNKRKSRPSSLLFQLNHLPINHLTKIPSGKTRAKLRESAGKLRDSCVNQGNVGQYCGILVYSPSLPAPPPKQSAYSRLPDLVKTRNFRNQNILRAILHPGRFGKYREISVVLRVFSCSIGFYQAITGKYRRIPMSYGPFPPPLSACFTFHPNSRRMTRLCHKLSTNRGT